MRPFNQRELTHLQHQRAELLREAGALLGDPNSPRQRRMSDENQMRFLHLHTQADDLLQKINDFGPDTRTAGREDIVAKEQRTMKNNGNQKNTGPDWEAYRMYLRGGVGALSPQLRAEHDARLQAFTADDADEFRALSSSVGGSGAYTIPEGPVQAIDVAMQDHSGALACAEAVGAILRTDHGRTVPCPTVNDLSNAAEQTSENSAVTDADDDPDFGSVDLGAFMYDSKVVKVPIALLQDSASDMEPALNDLLSDRLGRLLNTDLTNGDGTGKCKGFLRDSVAGVTAASPTAITHDELLSLVHSVNPVYRKRPGCRWQFNDNTLKAIRRLKDSAQRPLFVAGGTTEGIQNGAPDTLLGFPYTVNTDMPDLGAGLKSIAFGDWSKFRVRLVSQIAIMRLSERYAEKLQVGFLAYIRADSRMVDAGGNPIKHLVHPMS